MQSTNMINRNGNGTGHAICSSARKDRVLVRFIGHLHDLMIWPKRATIQSLQRRHNISRRTLLRDFAKLRENGIPVKFDTPGGYYYLPNSYLNPAESQEVSGAVGEDGGDTAVGLHPEWPLRWSETVALFAVLEGAKPPANSELQSLARMARDKLMDWVEIALRDRSGSVFSNAKLLVEKPSLSISELHNVMERFWSRKEKTVPGSAVAASKEPLSTPLELAVHGE